MRLSFTLALRYLRGRPLRAALTTLAVLLGAMVVFVVNVLLPTVLEPLDPARAARSDADLTITHATGGYFGADAVGRIRAVPGVRTASGVLSQAIRLPADYYDGDPGLRDAVLSLRITGVDPANAQTSPALRLVAGRPLRAGDTDAALIPSSVATPLGLAPGGSLRIPTPRGNQALEVVGILEEERGVVVTLETAGRLLDRPGVLSAVEVELQGAEPAANPAAEPAAPGAEAAANPAAEPAARGAEPGARPAAVPTSGPAVDPAATRRLLAARLDPGLRIDAQRSSLGLLSNLSASEQVLRLIGILSLFMGGFIILNTFRTVVTERRRDLAMLRTIGASRRTVMSVILVEGLLQGTIGSIAGLAAGYLFARTLLSAMSGVYEQMLHVRLGPPALTWSLVATTLSMGIGTTLLAGLVPALQASRVSPLEAFRPPADPGRHPHRWTTATGAVLLCVAAASLFSGHLLGAAVGALLFLAGMVLLAPGLVAPIAGLLSRTLEALASADGVAALARGNLARAPSRAAVTASSTMIALAIVVAVAALSISVRGGMEATRQASMDSDFLLIPPSLGLWEPNVTVDPALASRLRALPGVETVATVRYASSAFLDRTSSTPPLHPSDLPLPPAGVVRGEGGRQSTLSARAAPTRPDFRPVLRSEDHPISVLGIDPVDFPKVSGLLFLRGDPAGAYAALARGRGVILNGAAASSTGARPGDTLELETAEGPRPFTVAGVAVDFVNLKLATAYVSQAVLESDFHQTGDVMIQLDLEAGVDAAMLEPRIREAAAGYPQLQVISGEAFHREEKRLIDSAYALMYVLVAALALPSFIAMANTLAIGVIERLREIATLRAIGSTRRQVRRMVLAEALILAVIGTSMGLLAGLYLGYLVIAALRSGGYPVEFSFPWPGIVVASAAGLAFGALAAVLPARRVARTDVIRALRYE